ncbi:glycosyl hydrolase [Cohnella sp. GbtcB17]|uniref:glycosyl hydrolase n=1 Tax=Cohnella sp. GbtcB17 TaxID=2824762 RepID=UPI001C30EFCE|nr:glycosyl hydrolase [Cohnella sp. GbtcB17]
MINLQAFNDPPSSYRPAPLWVWNDDMTDERIREQLRELKDAGFGGAFVHPRPGLVTEYLSEDWFARWACALEEAQRLGIKLYIYDENSYPSGFGGGHVSAELPDCAANSVYVRKVGLDGIPTQLHRPSPAMNRPGHPIRVYACEPCEALGDGVAMTHDLTYVPAAEWSDYGSQFVILELGTPDSTGWLGGFSYMDLLRPEVAATFLSNVYEAYRQRFGGRFGESIPALFTDEPAISGSAVYSSGRDFLPFSYWFAAEFDKRNGYSLKDHLPCLFMDASGAGITVESSKVRYDYYCTMRELWVDNYIRPISEWCRTHGIAWTGHFMEHHWPFPSGMASPAVMSLYEYMQWPAIDFLMTFALTDKPYSQMMLTMREVHSAANQFGRERVLCESYGAGGWDSNLADYKRIGDYLYVNGINFLNQHYTSTTIAGARKRDHPQSFDWRQSWWPEYQPMNDYFGRLSYLLSLGKTVNRVLVLHPTTTGFLIAPADEDGSLEDPAHPPSHPDMRPYLALLQRLAGRQWDYDLGDEFIMERHGRVEGPSLVIGACTYEVVVFPQGIETLRSSTLSLLAEYLKAGGTIVALGEPCTRVDGEKSGAAEELAKHPNWRRTASLKEAEIMLLQQLSPRIEGVPEHVEGIQHLRRELDDGSSFYFLTNSASEPFVERLTVKGVHAERWNPWTGDTEAVSYTVQGDFLLIPLTLEPIGSDLIRVYQDREQPPQTSQPKEPPGVSSSAQAADAGSSAQSVRSKLLGIERIVPEADNVLVLDYCDLYAGGKEYSGYHTIHAGWLVYEHHGFEANPWDNAIQYKRRLLDRNRFDERSGFTAIFRFKVGEGQRPERLRVAVERAAYYRLSVNGHPVDWSEGETWLDHHIGVADIGSRVTEGDNVIALTTQRFDIRLELETIYLLGAFAVREEEGRWTLGSPQSLTIGSWTSQGYPFYGHAVRYHLTYEADSEATDAALAIGEWLGSVVSVEVNGRPAGMFGVGRGDRLPIGGLTRPGRNEIVLRVCGSLKNLLGPHHDADRPRKRAWPTYWKKAPLTGPPAAAAYDLLELGLLELPNVEWTPSSGE